jgi:signal transduction histidine kinase
MDRRGDAGDGVGSGPGGDARDEDGGVFTKDLADDLLRSGPLTDDLLRGSQAQSGLQPPKPIVFADVARQVWSAELEQNPEPNAKPSAEHRQLRPVPAAAAAAAQPVESRAEVSAGAAAAVGYDLEPAAGTGERRAGPDRTSAEQRTEAGGAYGPAQGLAQGPAQGLAPAEAQSLAHDANNLLSALRLYSELLCFSGVLHERHRHYAEDLKLLSLRSQRLIEQLLLLAEQVGVAQALPREAAASLWPDGASSQAASRLETGALQAAADAATGWEEWTGVAEVTPETISLSDTVRRISGLLGTIARGTLAVNLPEGADLRVAIGEEPLERILVNLVANAAAAIREGGAVRIRAVAAEGDPEAVTLTVDDSGRGMSEAQLAGALRGDSAPAAETAGRKRGLGLAIVQQLVAESGGRLFAYSQPGRGTRIEIRWESVFAGARPGDSGLRTGSQPGLAAGFAPASEAEFQPGRETESRPLPFLSWSKAAWPSRSAGPVAAKQPEAAARRGETGRSELSETKGAVAC